MKRSTPDKPAILNARSLLLVVPVYADTDQLPEYDPTPMSQEHAGVDPEVSRGELRKLGGLATLRAQSEGLEGDELVATEDRINKGLVAIAQTLYPQDSSASS